MVFLNCRLPDQTFYLCVQKQQQVEDNDGVCDHTQEPSELLVDLCVATGGEDLVPHLCAHDHVHDPTR